MSPARHRCAECGEWIDPLEEPHWLHEEGCDEIEGCDCDLYACPRCCPACNVRECEGQMSIEGVA